MSNTADKQALLAEADRILELNDRGRYTVPTHGLYPFQWNWDSCLVALGQRHNDETRAWLELETLFEHQWDDGLCKQIDRRVLPRNCTSFTYQLCCAGRLESAPRSALRTRFLWRRERNVRCRKSEIAARYAAALAARDFRGTSVL